LSELPYLRVLEQLVSAAQPLGGSFCIPRWGVL